MQNLIGIINSINAGSSAKDYKGLAKNRPEYMLPFGARYRIIDFTLSNISRHNLSNVIIFGGRNIRSTLDHIGNGKSWELNRRSHGLTINPPSYDIGVGSISELKSYYDAMEYFLSAKEEYIYLVDPMTINKIDIEKAYDDFREKNWDVMLIYKDVEDKNLNYLNTYKLHIDDDNKVNNIGENLGTENSFSMFLNKLFIKKSVFVQLIAQAIEMGNANTLIEAIIANVDNLNIGALSTDTHAEVIRDLSSFYNSNLNLLISDVYNEVFYDGGMILTKSKDEPSTLYRKGSKVVNSLVANGCIIEGHVENSIIFRGVKIGKNAIVKNSLLIQQSVVEEDAVVVNTIVDKFGIVEKGVSIVGAPGNPFVVEKGDRIRKE